MYTRVQLLVRPHVHHALACACTEKLCSIVNGGLYTVLDVCGTLLRSLTLVLSKARLYEAIRSTALFPLLIYSWLHWQLTTQPALYSILNVVHARVSLRHGAAPLRQLTPNFDVDVLISTNVSFSNTTRLSQSWGDPSHVCAVRVLSCCNVTPLSVWHLGIFIMNM